MARRAPFVSTLLALVLLGLAPGAKASLYVFGVNLDGPSESPPNASPGTGVATVTVDDSALTMRVEIAFSDLLGTTTASHIHAATAIAGTGTAGVATQTPSFTGFPLGVTSGAMDNLFDMSLASSYNAAYVTAHGGTAATAFVDLLQAMQDGKSYLNIHTDLFPGGEIRGFLYAVPEPSSLALLGAGGLGLLAAARRRRRARA